MQGNLKRYLKKQEKVHLFLSRLKERRKKPLVLIHDFKKEPFAGKIIHVDFYQPALDKEIEAHVALVFEGEAPAVKELGRNFGQKLFGN